jgi:hypothetical protein
MKARLPGSALLKLDTIAHPLHKRSEANVISKITRPGYFMRARLGGWFIFASAARKEQEQSWENRERKNKLDKHD